MRYKYWLHLRGPDNLSFVVSSFNASKTRLHKIIDFYSKEYVIEQLLIQPDVRSNL